MHEVLSGITPVHRFLMYIQLEQLLELRARVVQVQMVVPGTHLPLVLPVLLEVLGSLEVSHMLVVLSDF
jgi:hypothetical protein